jgi:hypothetical protein
MYDNLYYIRNMKPLLTKEQIESRLSYNPDTGEFRFKTVTPEDFPGNKHAVNLAKARNAQLKGVTPGCKDKFGYITISVNNVNYKAHILAMIILGRYEQGKAVDHINGVTSDNRDRNLRMVTMAQNSMNARHRGRVEWDPEKRRWAARVTSNGKIIRIGRHRTKGLAMLACAKWSLKNHGKYSLYYRSAERLFQNVVQ